LRVIADFILAYPRTILLAIVILTVASVFPASRIGTDFNLEGFFPDDSPTIEEYRQLSDEFGRDDNIIALAFEVPDVFSQNVVRDIATLTQELELISNVTEVNSIWNVSQIRNNDGMLVTSAYFDGFNPLLPIDELRLEEIRADMLRNPFIVDLMVNKQATVAAIYIELNEDVNSYRVRGQVIADISRILSLYQDTYNFRITGIPYFRNMYVDMLNKEIIMYVSISSVLIIALLWGLFRNLRGIIIPISIVWLTILFTVAFIVLTGGYFEILSSSIAPILLCVGVADSIHLLTKYQDSRLNGFTPGIALKETIVVLGSATLLTSITTAIGFATLVTSNVMPMKRFGLYTAAGVLIAFLITIFLLPTLLPKFRDTVTQAGKQNQVHNFLGKILRKTCTWATLNHKSVVITTILISLFFAYGATQLKVNGKIFDDVGPSQQIMKDSDFFTQKLTPQFPLEFVIDTGVPNGALSPDLLREIDAFESWLTSFDEIERTTSLTTLIEEIHRVMSPEEALRESLPSDAPLIAQYMLLLELSDSEAASRLVDFNYQTIRLASNVQDAGSWRTNQIREEIFIWLSDKFPDATISISGTSILVADLTDNIVRSLSSSILLAILFISIIMAWLFRDIRLVFISIMPNVIPLIITAGTMGFLGVDIKPSTAVIFTIAFGIAVDDSIHYLARLRIEATRVRNLGEAIALTTEKTGRAIVLTSVILMVGFGTLATSAFTSTMLMGTLTCLTIITALLADLLFLPAILHWMKPNFNGNPEVVSLETRSDHAASQPTPAHQVY
jgi:uncharacterized protein